MQFCVHLEFPPTTTQGITLLT